MLMDIVWLVAGLVLILLGANWLTDGSSAIARRMGVSDLVVGLTVVAFGTSAPELVISVISAINGSAPLAIGNVVGSNIFNVFVIIGITALVRPIVVERSILTMEIPMLILSSVILLILGNSGTLGGSSGNIVSRADGLLLLIFFLLFMRYTFATAKRQDEPGNQEIEQVGAEREMPVWKAVLFVVAGLGALIWGGDRFVDGATAIALGLGISEAVVGLTIVAAGTSLPELATSIVAAVKGKPGLAVGNVIGSNIFNALMVLGVSATITPLPFGGIGNFDLLILLYGSLSFWFYGWLFKERTITRVEGGLLAACYVGYVGLLISNL